MTTVLMTLIICVTVCAIVNTIFGYLKAVKDSRMKYAATVEAMKEIALAQAEKEKEETV